MSAFGVRKITSPVKITYADRSGSEPLWFFGGVAYLNDGDPQLDRFLDGSSYGVEDVPVIPAAYRQAIEDLSDEDRNRIGLPVQDAQMPGRLIREPYL